MAGWTLGVAKTGKISSKEMEQHLGRLGFAANALTWERPFLGPLYSCFEDTGDVTYPIVFLA